MGFGAVAAFRRDVLTGVLTFIGVYSAANGVPGLFEVDTVTVSPDGAHVYAVSNGDDTVVVFERDAQTGETAPIRPGPDR